LKASRRKEPVPGYVRIIGGEWRRRRIAVPATADVRPTPDRVRETLFNWLAPWLPGAHCLDLFAGTGVLAFEALSRGAESAVLIENDQAAVAALESVGRELGATAEILRVDALAFLQRSAPAVFDVVFVDPPYARPVDDLLAALPRVIRPGGRVYLERDRTGPWPEAEGFAWEKSGTAGAIRFGLATIE